MVSLPDVDKNELELFLNGVLNQEAILITGQTILHLLRPDVSILMSKNGNYELDEAIFKDDSDEDDFSKYDPLEVSDESEGEHSSADDSKGEKDKTDVLTPKIEIKEIKSKNNKNDIIGHFKCHKCGKTQTRHSNHLRHMAMHLKHERNEIAGKCEKCGKEFLDSYNLKRHLANNCNKINKKEEEEDKFCPCEVCGETVERRWKWKHMRKHKPKQFCELCGEWRNGVNFKWHACFNKRPSQVCNICGGMFKDLAKHIRKNHENKIIEKKIKCDVCGCSVPESNLSKHMTKFHNGNRETQVCPHCGKKVFRLENHIRTTHTADDKKKIQCPDCAKGFIDDHLYQKHRISVHEKTYPFSCRYENCEAKYNDSSNRNCHERKKHGAVYE